MVRAFVIVKVSNEMLLDIDEFQRENYSATEHKSHEVLKEVHMRRALAVIVVMAVMLGVPVFGAGQVAPSGTRTFDETVTNTGAAIKSANVSDAGRAGAVSPST